MALIFEDDAFLNFVTGDKNFKCLICLFAMKAINEHEDRLKALFIEYLASSESEFHQLHDELAPRVISYLRKRLRREEDVAEVYQGFFVKLHKSRSQYKKDNPFIPWIYSILKSELLDFVKIQGRHQRRIEAYFLDQMSQNEALPSSNLLSKEQEFLGLLAELGLSPEAEELLKMRFAEDMSTKQMSEKLQISEPALRKRLSRLMESVKGELVYKKRNSPEGSQDEG